MGDDGGGLTAAAVRGIVKRVFGGESNVSKLVSFAQNPIQFIRKRVAPTILGFIFGFAFDIAEIIRQPFIAAGTGFETAATAIEDLISTLFFPIQNLMLLIIDWIAAGTTGFGPLQPFVVSALAILLMYGVLVATIRLVRAVSGSIPILSGVEAFFSR